VDDPRRVGLGQAVRRLDRKIEKLLHGEGARRDQLAEAPPRYKLHGDVVHGVRGAHVVDGDDARVVEGGGGAGLLLEALASLGIAGHLGGQDLDGDVAAELAVPGPVDLSRPPRAQRREDLIRSDASSRQEGHQIPFCGGTG
jgi:hypothetical protein